ncbi:pilin [Stenotrophomonas sp. CC120222-04]|uniref:pilin n=1 Tax=Stenotrophomonas sp. CC120222-04 TaxID=1378088 RepID=UPI000B68F061|nr:pilin [Stenotrophomonas sp. CC120222-04]SNT80861.1 type IV pilus assembly protein PilA [Stenotrophomonas sp. CC120222-04]
MKNQKGFTLIELMIVVAIIAILAAIALPAYSNYTKKAKVSEVILAASSLRTDVSEYVASNNKLPGSDWKPDFQETKYVKSVTWDGDKKQIVATAQAIGDTNIDAKTITLTPDDSKVGNGVVPAWTCAGSIDTKFRPGSCQGAASTTSGGGTSGG